MSIARFVAFIVCSAASCDVISAAPVLVASLEKMALAADVILVAEVAGPPVSTAHGISVRLDVIRVLKGTAGSRLSADFLLPWGVVRQLVPEMDGRIGLFLLQRTAASYNIMARRTGDIRLNDAFYPAVRSLQSGVLPGNADLVESVLVEVIAGYADQGTAATPGDELLVLSALATAAPRYAVRLSRWLTGPTMPDKVRIIGIAGLISLGSQDGLQVLDREADTLARHKEFGFITEWLQVHYKPKSASDVALLRQLYAHHPGLGELHGPIGAALSRLGTRDAMPALVALLDSPHVDAQLRALRALERFALLADERGELRQSEGPWASTSQRTPSREAFLEDRGRYVRYWQAWWEEHRAAFGH